MSVLPMRRVLFAFAALAAVLIYLIWWVTYAGIHYIPRYTLRPPGVAGEVQGTSVRLLSLTRAEQLADGTGTKPGLPDPGAVWIVAEFEAVRHDAAQDFLCDTQLMGPQRRPWSPAATRVTRATPRCSPDDLVVGQPLRFESIFMVPVRYADQLAGVALPDNSTAARTPVIRPL
jgi:hypothetical protein